MIEDGPREPAPVLCVCGDLQTLHQFGTGHCMRVRRGSPCECPKYEEPAPVLEEAAAEPGRRSLVDEFTVKGDE